MLQHASDTESNPALDLRKELVDLNIFRSHERTPDPLIVFAAYAQDSHIYQHGQMVEVDKANYDVYKNSADVARRNDLVNKFGLVYAPGSTLLLHKRLADVLLDTAIDMHRRYGQFTVVMDGLRTYDAGVRMQNNRPDLVDLGLLAKAGNSAHNRALAVDSKLFVKNDEGVLIEADEGGHLDDEIDMKINSRFYSGALSQEARQNRLHRLQAWQRASVKNKTPIANLLAEFWDDRVPGSPADLWRVLVCRMLCLELDGNPNTNSEVAALKNALTTLHDAHRQGQNSRKQFSHEAYGLFVQCWARVFTTLQQDHLEQMLGKGAGQPPACEDFIFHEWLQTIHDKDLISAGFPPQTRPQY